MASPLLIQQILVPLDFSNASLNAVDHAVTLAKLSNAAITLIHVTEHFNDSASSLFVPVLQTEMFEKEVWNAVDRSLRDVQEKIVQQGIKTVEVMAVTGRTYKEIVLAAKKRNVDIIVMGTHGVSGFQEFATGSNTYRVINDAPCPVMSVQAKIKATKFKNILVPFSTSPHSREKLMYAIKVAQLYGATLHVLGIDEKSEKVQLNKIGFEALQIKNLADAANIKSKVKTMDGIYNSNTILDYADEIKADLIIIMGDAIKQDVTEYFIGSASQAIINHSKIPVLSIHSKVSKELLKAWQEL